LKDKVWQKTYHGLEYKSATGSSDSERTLQKTTIFVSFISKHKDVAIQLENDFVFIDMLMPLDYFILIQTWIVNSMTSISVKKSNQIVIVVNQQMP
jgi:hypothetical protein